MKYYPIVNIPIPTWVPMRPGGLEILPDGRIAAGTGISPLRERAGCGILALVEGRHDTVNEIPKN